MPPNVGLTNVGYLKNAARLGVDPLAGLDRCFWFQLECIGAGWAPSGSDAFQHMLTSPCPPRMCLSLP